ncbi:hypothetical protein MVS59_004377 [Salmonella enterica]|nr:hypothetical protein [Salmonella enterica subsp. diarizonae serovar 48:i:z]EEH1875090.1 hypothetical protein [Salmonella enterica]EEM2739082.1 hypothetical protein [Salmonella enterica]EEM9676503.1 hypothetical protein [Salmonella enterica]EEN5935299.1 hypothetical protein [Salmonella enterica]
MRYLRLLFVAIVVTYSLPGIAFQVDTLSKIIAKDSESLVVTGDTGREYLYTSLSRVQVDSAGNIQEFLLSPEDVENWPVIVEPGEIIIDRGDDVRVKINRNGQPLLEDTVLGLSFIPEHAKVNEQKGSGLQMSVGYKTWLFIPGTSQLRGKISAYRNGDKIFINNSTNKILRVVFNGDKNENGLFMSLPGTKKEFDSIKGEGVIDFYLVDKSERIKEIKL